MCLRQWMLAISCVGVLHAETLPVPLGLDAYVPAPESNRLTREKVNLGRALFFFTGLSRDRTLSCASCHVPERAFTDGKPRAVGVDGQVGTRRTPPLLNRAWGKSFFWDGRTATLEEQVLQPVLNPLEMGLQASEIVQRVKSDDALRSSFGSEPKREDIANALASYVRSILSGGSAYDRYVAGNRTALTEEQQFGLRLFRGKANCVTCHVGPNLTDERLHNTGAGKEDTAFKTPGLREVTRTAPYMHDGSLTTLEDVIEFYDKGGRENPNLDAEMRELKLTPQEKRALVALLKSFSGKLSEGWP